VTDPVGGPKVNTPLERKVKLAEFKIQTDTDTEYHLHVHDVDAQSWRLAK
jgi:hypothetical protein